MDPPPSRSTSPLPEFYPSCSDNDESDTSLQPLWLGRHRRPPWWSAAHRRRRGRRTLRTVRRWLRRIAQHPFFPAQPITIVITLILFSAFAIALTLLLMYILNPDKEPLPWRAYCSSPALAPPFDRPLPPGSPTFFPNVSYGDMLPAFPPDNFDSLSPAGVFVGVFSIDSSVERRMQIRSMWSQHPRSRNGAGHGDDGQGTSRTIVRFILAQPRKTWERRVKLEMDMYNDMVILPIPENMNSGKSHTYFSWAALNAWVPPLYSKTLPSPTYTYSNASSVPPRLAAHDPKQAWTDVLSGNAAHWVHPDYVVKVDDDAFLMLAELEGRLRVEIDHWRASNPTQDPLIYWGYLITNRLHQFMAGELYALSFALVDWVSKDERLKTMIRGAEDKQTAKWMRIHPQANQIRWSSERCWIYDHPRAGTVYAHGFLFPSEVTRVKGAMRSYLDEVAHPTPSINGSTQSVGLTLADWAKSSVSTFHQRYTPPLADLSTSHSMEALVEGSKMSQLREGSPMSPNYAWTHREGRKARYEGKRLGGTAVVHFIKQNMWYLETALAMLEGEEFSESEKYEQDRQVRQRTP